MKRIETDEDFVSNTVDLISNTLTREQGETGKVRFYNLLDTIAYKNFWAGFIIGSTLTLIIALLTVIIT